jgi:hypothetical protein
MGIDTPAIALLSAARRVGVDFTSTLMIGRQNFVGHFEPGLRRLFREHGIALDARDFAAKNHFCEELFRLLGANQIESMDVSDYEQATHIHDMNLPIPSAFSERYSCVFDSGSIEHVFNIPQALKNCLQMVKLNGYFLQATIANNYLGHGFWQLSPELIFRALSPENGFEILAVLLHEGMPGGAWHRVADPATVGGRVELCNSRPTFMMTIAKRAEIKEIFTKPPQQSDYVAEWQDAPRDIQSQMQRVRRSPIRRLIGKVAKIVLNRPRLHVYDPHHYQKLSESQVWNGDILNPKYAKASEKIDDGNVAYVPRIDGSGTAGEPPAAAN